MYYKSVFKLTKSKAGFCVPALSCFRQLGSRVCVNLWAVHSEGRSVRQGREISLSCSELFLTTWVFWLLFCAIYYLLTGVCKCQEGGENSHFSALSCFWQISVGRNLGTNFLIKTHKEWREEIFSSRRALKNLFCLRLPYALLLQNLL